MKLKIYFQIILAFTVLANTNLNAQDETIPSDWSAQLNIQHQDYLFDFNFGQLGVVYQVGIRPQVGLEVQKVIKRKENKSHFLTGQLGIYNNPYNERWSYLRLGYGKERIFDNGFFFNIRMEAGVARVSNIDPQYILEDGKWVVTDNYATPHVDFMFGPRLDLGYRISDAGNPIDVVLNSNLNLHLNPEIGGIPYRALGFGVRYGF
jgi:hypothetical protein